MFFFCKNVLKSVSAMSHCLHISSYVLSSYVLWLLKAHFLQVCRMFFSFELKMTCNLEKAQYSESIFNSLTPQDYIGDGTYGHVDIVKDERTNTLYARKTFKLELESDFLREVACLKLFKHEHIITIVDVLYNNYNFPIILMPNIPSDLLELLYAKTLSMHVAHTLIVQVIDAIKHMHNLNFIHADLKPANVLCQDVQEDGMCHIKICDFGLTHKFDKCTMHDTSPVQSLGYRAPEVCLEYQLYDMSVDLYSIGILYLQMMLGFRKYRSFIPYPASDEMMLIICIQISGMISGKIPEFWRKLQRFETIRDTTTFPYLTESFGVNTKYKLYSFKDFGINDPLTTKVLSLLLHLDCKQRSLPSNQTCKDLVHSKNRNVEVTSHSSAHTMFVPGAPTEFQNLWAYKDFQKVHSTQVPEKMKSCTKQPLLEMRNRAFNLIVSALLSNECNIRTIFSSLDLMDRFSSVACIRADDYELLLVSTACLSLSWSMYEDDEFDFPAWIHPNQFTLKDLKSKRREVCHCLDYRLWNPCILDVFDKSDVDDAVDENSLLSYICIQYHMKLLIAKLSKDSDERSEIQQIWQNGYWTVCRHVIEHAMRVNDESFSNAFTRFKPQQTKRVHTSALKALDRRIKTIADKISVDKLKKIKLHSKVPIFRATIDSLLQYA